MLVALGSRKRGLIMPMPVASGPVLLIHDQFTDPNGTLLTAHTVAPINTPAATWAVATGTGDIQSNKANVAVATLLATLNLGLANFRLTVDVTTSSNGGSASVQGVVLRFTDGSNHWLAGFNASGDELRISEVNAGITTIRATVAMTVNASTTYPLEVICNGTVITATSGAFSCNYGSASHNQTATAHGLRSGVITQWDELKMYSL